MGWFGSIGTYVYCVSDFPRIRSLLRKGLEADQCVWTPVRELGQISVKRGSIDMSIVFDRSRIRNIAEATFDAHRLSPTLVSTS